ncbi:MAG: hypothetical protein AAGC77_00510 [Pseudomonadota bacterium]
MSFQEKSAWAVMIITALVFTPLAMAFFAGHPLPPTPRLIGTMIGFVILIVISQILIGLFSPKSASAPTDEREQRIELRAERVGGFVLAVFTIGLVWFAVKQDASRIAVLAFLGLAASEFVKRFWQIVLYRREA